MQSEVVGQYGIKQLLSVVCCTP